MRLGGGGKLPSNRTLGKDTLMIALGLILLLIGVLLGVGLLYSLGAILLVIGVVLYVLGATNHAVAGRRHYW